MKKSENFWQEVKNAAGKGLPCPEYKMDVDTSKNFYQLNSDVFNLIDELEDKIHNKNISTYYGETLMKIDYLLHQMKHHYLELEYKNNKSNEVLKNKLIESRKELISRTKVYSTH